jgi:hypothetical protein
MKRLAALWLAFASVALVRFAAWLLDRADRLYAPTVASELKPKPDPKAKALVLGAAIHNAFTATNREGPRS